MVTFGSCVILLFLSLCRVGVYYEGYWKVWCFIVLEWWRWKYWWKDIQLNSWLFCHHHHYLKMWCYMKYLIDKCLPCPTHRNARDISLVACNGIRIHICNAKVSANIERCVPRISCLEEANREALKFNFPPLIDEPRNGIGCIMKWNPIVKSLLDFRSSLHEV